MYSSRTTALCRVLETGSFLENKKAIEHWQKLHIKRAYTMKNIKTWQDRLLIKTADHAKQKFEQA